MDVVSLLIWVMALLLGVVAYLRPGRLHVQGVRIAWKQIVSMVPRVVMAVMVSGFFSMIIPMDYVVNWIGRESGIRGILVASMVGGFTPGGPLICFPIVLVLYKTGAGIPQLMAFVTAWSVFAFHRIVSYEAPLMGFRFVVLRVMSSLLLPPISGCLAAIIESKFPMGI
ncbi:MAG: hypothetical protein A2170_05940 [Deltaproteobacteria bacterium RBG_13_53_10]|nr:MAG: hypothetical protein A2170_05940 [Deltaproteobacteria bacterium RBG_13_53_10]